MPEHEPIGPQAILAKKQRYLIPCSYHFYRDPPQIVRGQGVYVYDSTGRRCTDLYSGVSVHALGHCHPEMVETICRQVAALQHTSTIYLTEPIVNLAEQLAKVLPGQICRTFFYCSGSEANEGAALLATLHTGRSEFLAFQNGLHGRTKLGMSLTGLSFWRTDPNPIGGIVHVPPPHCRSCPFGQSLGQCQYQCVDAVEAAIRTATSGKPAAIERNRRLSARGFRPKPWCCQAESGSAGVVWPCPKASGCAISAEPKTAGKLWPTTCVAAESPRRCQMCLFRTRQGRSRTPGLKM